MGMTWGQLSDLLDDEYYDESRGYSVYILRCADGTLYTGIAKDVEHRLDEHNRGRGAKYTKGRGPCVIVAQRYVGSKSDALKLEARIKKQPKDKKVGVLLSHGKDPQISQDPAPGGIEAPKG